MQNTIIYPGTFDPITNGHKDIIRRALKLFDKLVLAVSCDTKKMTLFTCEERAGLARKSLSEFKNVEICQFSGLLIKFAKEKNVKAILRGIRATSDFEYEFQLAGVNRHLDHEIETIFFTPAEKFINVSSSMIKEAALLGGDISDFIHEDVQKALLKKASKRIDR